MKPGDEVELGEVKSFRDLVVWQLGMELAETIYRLTEGFPKNEVFGLTSQMRRAAVSVPSNIAEGHSRQSRGEYLQSVGHARGSLSELETQLELAIRLGMISKQSAVSAGQLVVRVGQLLNGLRNSLC